MTKYKYIAYFGKSEVIVNEQPRPKRIENINGNIVENGNYDLILKEWQSSCKTIPIEEELWTNIKGFEGVYQISTHGRVRSLDRNVVTSNGVRRKKGIMLKPHKMANGYTSAVLGSNNKLQHIAIHVLVAEHFIPNDTGKRIVNHIDLDKSNNRVDNLEWVNHSENHVHYERQVKGADTISVDNELEYKVVKMLYDGERNRDIEAATGLNKIQVQRLKKRYHFLLPDRIKNMFAKNSQKSKTAYFVEKEQETNEAVEFAEWFRINYRINLHTSKWVNYDGNSITTEELYKLFKQTK